MNRFTKTIAILGVILLAFGCKKNQFKQKHFDFSYADDIAGTYVGIRTLDGPVYWGMPPGTMDLSDTITVVVEDRRTDKVCSFYIDYLEKEFNVQPDGVFIDEQIISDPDVDTYYGYFKDGVLYYSKRTNYYKVGVEFYPLTMKLYKQ